MVIKWSKRLGLSVGGLLLTILIVLSFFKDVNSDLLFSFGYRDVYSGNNGRGNKVMNYALSMKDSITSSDYHSLSVQNTKNGNYVLAIDALEKGVRLDSEIHGYYGWVLLYYYRDYEKALLHLDAYDALTPGYSDFPMGESVNYLRGLSKMMMGLYKEAIYEFDTYIFKESERYGEKWVDPYAFFYKGRCHYLLGQKEESLIWYNKAIKYFNRCTMAFFYKGISYLGLNEHDSACYNINKAYDLIREGFKKSDPYVEIFDELYLQDIEQVLDNSCNHTLD